MPPTLVMESQRAVLAGLSFNGKVYAPIKGLSVPARVTAVRSAVVPQLARPAACAAASTLGCPLIEPQAVKG